MRIAVTSFEVFPFAKTGGLADVTGSLPKQWRAMGHDPIVIMPMHRSIDRAKYNIRSTQKTLFVPMGDTTEFALLLETTIPGTDVPVYLIEHNDYFDRPGIYGNPEGYEDNDKRFIFFSRAVFEVCRALNFSPDIIMANDYHTALVMPFLQLQERRNALFHTTAGIYTIHNMGYQGISSLGNTLYWSGLTRSPYFRTEHIEAYGLANYMKVALFYADRITTVSPGYAHEIAYTEHGHGLNRFVQYRGRDFHGILNGVDYSEWNPETDARIYERYSPQTLRLKTRNKVGLLHEHYGLPAAEAEQDIPLLGMISRLTDQKGIDLVEAVIDAVMRNHDVRFTLLGSGERRHESFFRSLQHRWPGRAFVTIGYNDDLSHKVEAGADIFLMPSKFEPCGLNQMYSLKYGTVPVVRATGGLADTVTEWDPYTGTGNGFVFQPFDAGHFGWAIERALQAYRSPAAWKKIQLNGMLADHSAERSAAQYITLFEEAVEFYR